MRGLALAGDVAFRPDNAQEVAGGVALGGRASVDVAQGAVAQAQDSEDLVEFMRALDEDVHVGDRRCAVFGMQAGRPIFRPTLEIGAVYAVDLERAVVPGTFPGGGVPLPDAEGGGAGGELEAFVELQQAFPGHVGFGDVVLNRDEIDEPAGGVVHGLDVDLLPVGPAVFGVVEDLDLAGLAGLFGFAEAGDGGGGGARTL